MKKLIALLLALALITGSALACGFVEAISGDTNIRTAPNLYGRILDVLPEGDIADFLFERAIDDRGVMWYLVDYYGTIGWVSTRYTGLSYC